MSLTFFTICAKNYLPIARTCLDSVRATHPEARVLLVLCDKLDQGYDPSREAFEVLAIEDLGIEDFGELTLRYDVMELNTAVKPFVFEHLFRSGHERIVYVDPDTYFLAPLEELVQSFEDGAEAVVTPHITEPIEDQLFPSDHQMLRVGVYNLGFLALRSTPSAQRFAHWWAQRLRTGSVVALEDGLFTDQKWCDLLPCFVPNTLVLRHPGYNLAYWNLMHRPVRKALGGEGWEAAGQALRFVHFSGASFSDPSVFSRHQDRYTRNDMGELGALYDAYRDLVHGNGLDRGPSYRYSYDFGPDGAPIPRVLREVYREGDAPRGCMSVEQRIRWALKRANAPAADLPYVHDRPVSHIMRKIWRDRQDLQAAFDMNSQNGRRDFVNWFVCHGAAEMNLDDRFVAPVREALALAPAEHGASTMQDAASAPAERVHPAPRLSRALLARAARWILKYHAHARPLYARLPIPWRHKLRATLASAGFAPPSVREIANTGDRSGPAAGIPGATLVGYGRAELGRGEDVRMSAAALGSQGASLGIYNVSVNVVARQEDTRFDDLFLQENRYKANIFHINADQLPIVCASLGERFLAERYNIAYPAWELAVFPDDWTPAFDGMDEIWAPSRFIQAAIREKVDRPVIWMPLAVEIADGYERWTRADFGIPEDAYVFLFNYDLASYTARKNPEAIVNAYRLAFRARPRTERRPFLVIKALSAQLHPEALDTLRKLVAADPDVMLITRILRPDQVHGLVNLADCFVSLHRSEGFGRGPAEAMRLGKPVIVTAYSGTLDFTNHANALLVPHQMIPLAADDYPYADGQYWADPSVEAAAAHMAKLCATPEMGIEIGALAKTFMIEHHSKSVVGNRYVQRLKAVGAL